MGKPLSKDKDKLLSTLADLLFAYTNKSEGLPHEYEVRAVNDAVDVLLSEYKGKKYSRLLIESSRIDYIS